MHEGSGIGTTSGAIGRPLVAVAYGPRCVPVMSLVEAATGLCDLLWLIDARLPDMAEMQPLLQRFGPVVDIGGRPTAELVAAIAAHGPRGLATYLDAGMVELAQLAAALNLEFHSPAVADALTDKARQRELLGSAGITVPHLVAVPPGPASDALAGLEDVLAWPAVVKPRRGQGSRSTFLAQDLREAIDLIDSLGESRQEMVIEDYLAGSTSQRGDRFADYVSVESLVAHGVVSHLALTGRFPLAENFRETGFFIPALLEEAERSAVLELAGEAIRALGVETGCLHTEVKFTPAGPRIIEVNGRVGGGVPEMLVRAAGIPLLELTLRIALGERVRLEGPVPTHRIGYRFFLQPPPMSATVGSIEGIEALADHPAVDTVSIHQGPGADVDWRDGSRNHILAVVGATKDYDELRSMKRLLDQGVTVTYSELAH